MTAWMYVTMDRYELPIFIADTSAELARIVGVKTNLIASAISKAKKRNGRCKYVKVVIDDDE